MNLNLGFLNFLRRVVGAVGVVAVVAVVAMAVSSCSTKKNSAASRRYQAFVTRYNVHFNGDQHFRETLREMERAYEDDYSSRLLMHPAEAHALPSGTKPSGSFTRSIEKAQKSIQLHSIKARPPKKAGKSSDPAYKEWLKRSEYNPFLHNSWMMMARAQYFNGDFGGAASTFRYIAKNFTWLPATVLEAKLWEARSYCAMDWLYEAEVIITRIKPEELTTSTLRELYYFTYADFYIRSHMEAKAIPMLAEAVKYASSAQKQRMTFLLGQLYASVGDKAKAYAAFKKAAGFQSASYRARFNARIKQSEVFDGKDIAKEVKSLRALTRYGTNKEYLDQIYYAIGNLYLSHRDTVNALANYELAVKKSKRNGIDKAIAQLALGALHFDRHRYDLAQPSYSEALPQLPETYPDYARLKRRSDVLDELAVYAQNVALNDSLLRLSAMTPEQQRAVVDKIIADLKKKEKEEAEERAREEYLANAEAAASANQAANNRNQANAPTQFQMNNDKSWYFYNKATAAAGRTDFQKRWGSRKLEDNWRRRNKATFDMNDLAATPDPTDEGASPDAAAAPQSGSQPDTADAKADEETKKREADPHFPEYYLKQIPKTDAERTVAADVIQEGLYNCGLILKDKLEDFDAAHGEWQRLAAKYPDNVYRLDIYYNEYLMNMRRGLTAEADKWRDRILAEFPDSKYALAMRDPNYIANLRAMKDVQEKLYEQAYNDYLANRNAAVHAAYGRMSADYPMSEIMPKFMFLHALAYVTEKKPAEFNATLKEMLERYPDTDLTPMASAMLKGVMQGRELHADEGGNTRGMLWDIRLTADSTAAAAAESIRFSRDPNEPHYLVMLFSTDSIAPNRLLFEVARHNFSTYVVRDFDLEMMNFGPLGLLIVKGFANEAELNHYRSLLSRDDNFRLPAGVRPVTISKSNFEKLLQSGGSFDLYFKFLEADTDPGAAMDVAPPEPPAQPEPEAAPEAKPAAEAE